jgi:ABC-type dipeptide/oligopeptide/nickel transport system ATPase component
MIFQDPMTSLNPVYRIGYQIVEAIVAHESISKKQAKRRAIDLLKQVGIPNAAERIDTYPHELSGGMRQRVMIALALSCNPDIVIADEPTTALDVTIQAQILALLDNLRAEFDSAVILITHDLGVVASIAHDILSCTPAAWWRPAPSGSSSTTRRCRTRGGFWARSRGSTGPSRRSCTRSRARRPR